MRSLLRTCILAALACVFSNAQLLAANLDSTAVKVVRGKDAVDVTIGGKLFTKYVFGETPRPYCYPIIGPGGECVTRHFPMKEVKGETKDHPHHRSLWFTFGNVNSVDFWTEHDTAGRIVHRRFEKLVSGKAGVIRSVNDWIGPDGKKVCEDVRNLRIARDANGTSLDFVIEVRATNGPLKFGDTKEGMFAVRVADSMTMDKGKGHILMSGGERDGAAWGKQASWCTFWGPVSGETVGITIMEHPTSFRHPTYWHARTYGLFAANPFGLKDFTGDKTKDGSYTVLDGNSVTFRYRVLIHEGGPDDADIANLYAAYAKSP